MGTAQCAVHHAADCGQRPSACYLKNPAFSGRILGFDIDPDFNHAIDVLIMVDLSRCNPHLLSRYMDRRGAADHLARHHAIKQAA